MDVLVCVSSVFFSPSINLSKDRQEEQQELVYVLLEKYKSINTDNFVGSWPTTETYSVKRSVCTATR
jgi:hypothetical protein